MNISAKIYQQYELNRELSPNKLANEAQEFVREFFVSKDPLNTVQQLIQNKTLDSLSVESKLNALLSEVARQPRQAFLQDFVNQMKIYPIKAYKMHEEGREPVAVFNLNAKAQGIENIWQATESFQFYTMHFNTEPLKTLQDLRGTFDSMNQSEWLGIKQSLEYINTENQQLITSYLLDSSDNRMGLDKFISRYVLSVADKDLTKSALQTLNKRNKQYLLRKLPQVFTEEFVVEQLIGQSNNQSSGAFAITLLKPFAKKNKQVQAFLVDALSNKNISSQAAYSLVSDHNDLILDQLARVYMQSKSPQQKHGIRVVLQMSQSTHSKKILQRINKIENIHSEKLGRTL